MNASLVLILLLVIAFSFQSDSLYANSLPGQIIVDPDNRAWLKYHDGGSFFLASPGDPEDFLYRGNMKEDGTREGDQVSLINKLKGTGANAIYFQIIRSHGGDGDATHNPFVNNNPSMGLNDLVLDQWEEWFQIMDSNGIVIYLFFYDDSANIWPTGDRVSAEEQAFFENIVNRFEHHRHLIWIIAEEYEEKLTSTRVSTLASIIKKSDDYKHPVAVHKNNGLAFNEFASDVNIDQFTIQYNEVNSEALHDGMVKAWNDANGRYNLNMSEAEKWGTGAEARQKAWSVALGGAYVMALGMNVASTPISDLEDLGRLRHFMESTNFNKMAPYDELAAADTLYVLANPGKSYIAYGKNSVTGLGIKSMVGGVYELKWFDPENGETIHQESVLVNNGLNVFTKPNELGDEAALYIYNSTLNSVPKPPTDIFVE